MTTSQVLTTEPKNNKNKNKLSKQLGIESQKWSSHGGLSTGEGERGGKIQRVSSINGR